ncbi:MAG: DUF3795 domain-containing protein [Erysipelotrichaceae bacterium]|nr:DUF3795 domain-containing protein [Erysipelotrichaceae bacterium]
MIEEEKIEKALEARKGLDPIAYCGFSCNHCKFGKWCGGCRSDYNICSFATVCEGNICTNAKCAKEKGLDGCFECDELERCEKGFYEPNKNRGEYASKAAAIFVKKYGKHAFLLVQNEFIKKYEPDSLQDLLNESVESSVNILEEAYKTIK